MGIINRFRARLHSLTSLSNKLEIKPNQNEDRTTKTMCILSAVLLVPCFARLPSPFLISCVGVAYVVVVLPMMLTGGSIQNLAKVVESYLVIAKGTLQACFIQLRAAAEFLLQLKNRVELCFLRLGNISTLLNQMIFFTMCDRCLCPAEKLNCLYSLIFYNVIAVCAAYLQQLYTKEDWSPYVHISKRNKVKHLAMTTTNMVLEFTKAVTFLITTVFMLLVIGLEQGLQQYRPTWTYILLTALYYILTEKIYSQNLPGLLERLDLERLEGLEKLWAPVIVESVGCLMSGALVMPLLGAGGFRLAAIAVYVNVYLCYKDLTTSAWSTLEVERRALSKFRHATNQEVRDIDDVCAVCLQPMRFARVTPCHHMFHGDCLRLCLKASTSCPMCKRNL